MNIFSKAVVYVDNIAHSAQSILVKIFGSSAVTKFESEVETVFKGDVMTVFADAINAAESLQVDGTPATGDQKRSAAFSKIVSDLKTNGVSLADNVINFGIELVVGFMKSKAPAATTTS